MQLSLRLMAATVKLGGRWRSMPPVRPIESLRCMREEKASRRGSSWQANERLSNWSAYGRSAAQLWSTGHGAIHNSPLLKLGKVASNCLPPQKDRVSNAAVPHFSNSAPIVCSQCRMTRTCNVGRRTRVHLAAVERCRRRGSGAGSSARPAPADGGGAAPRPGRQRSAALPPQCCTARL